MSKLVNFLFMIQVIITSCSDELDPAIFDSQTSVKVVHSSKNPPYTTSDKEKVSVTLSDVNSAATMDIGLEESLAGSTLRIESESDYPVIVTAAKASPLEQEKQEIFKNREVDSIFFVSRAVSFQIDSEDDEFSSLSMQASLKISQMDGGLLHSSYNYFVIYKLHGIGPVSYTHLTLPTR